MLDATDAQELLALAHSLSHGAAALALRLEELIYRHQLEEVEQDSRARQLAKDNPF